MTVFRPCIDLHDGKVKQIVGGSLRDHGAGPIENFVAEQPAAYFAERYRRDGLAGGHVIKLGAGNDEAALSALRAYPQGLQIGGGITPENAPRWLDAGARAVIVTSYLFEDNELSIPRVVAMSHAVGASRLVIDLSCRQVSEGWCVATNRWQTLTHTQVNAETLAALAPYCCEFLVHAADVEGKCQGIDEDLVRLLGEHSPLPCTYAGGGRAFADLELVESLSQGRVDLTFGSALDLFGGSGVHYADCVTWNHSRA